MDKSIHVSFMRRIGTIVVLMAYVMASMGVMPSAAAVRRWCGIGAGERFPCEDHGCGCATARECWTRCCCHDPRERLRWAIENGVMPPEGVDVADDEWIAASNEVRAGSAHCGLCVERIKDDLRAGIGRGGDEDERPARGGGRGERGERTKAAREGSSCCAGREGDRGTQPDSRGGSRGGGAALSALACKGLTTMLVVGLPPAMPPSGWAAWSPEPVRGEVVRISNERHASRALETPEPPPRGA